MRKSPTIAPRVCKSCGCTYTPVGTRQSFCKPCSDERDKKRKHDFYVKTHPNAKPKVKRTDPCCICGNEFRAMFDGKPYCNKHYLRMYLHGVPYRIGRSRTNTYDEQGDVTIVTVKDGRTFLIDTDDLLDVQRYSWCFNKQGYPVAHTADKIIRLSRYLLNVQDDNLVVDHINGNPADNRRSNLRICTAKENSRNTGVSKNNKSGYLGIRITPNKRYEARICVNRKSIHIGTYDTLDEALSARCEAEIDYFGEYAPSVSRV